MTDFSDQFRKIIMRYKRIGYYLNVKRQSACLVINPITVDGYAANLKLQVGGSGVRLHDGPDLKLFILVGWDRSFRLLLGPPGLNCLSSFASDFQWCCLTDQGSPSVMQHIVYVESSSLLLHNYLTRFIC